MIDDSKARGSRSLNLNLREAKKKEKDVHQVMRWSREKSGDDERIMNLLREGK
jgi:hypothetical protein